VATVYALEDIDDHLVIVSEYVDGEPLRSLIARGPVEPARAGEIAAQIARGLSAAHEAGVVHRDLKPENVLLTRGGAVKVVDFGIAHVEGPEATRLTRSGALLGTPAYMAPEQLLGGAVDGRADLYALGVLLTEMLTGQHPLSPGGARATPPAAFAGVIARCIQPDPSARFASARDLLAALESSAGGPPGGALADGRQSSPSPATAAELAAGYSIPVPTASAAAGSPRWWWEFHQATAALVYWLMVVPAWYGRVLIAGAWGRAFFIITLVSVIVAANLRLHLWFTSRFYPSELKFARRRVGRWIRGADWVFVIVLAAGGLIIGEDRSPIAVLMLAVAIGTAIVFLVIERVTTRAAFGARRSNGGAPANRKSAGGEQV
jgi:serine/threonine-protein kinase